MLKAGLSNSQALLTDLAAQPHLGPQTFHTASLGTQSLCPAAVAALPKGHSGNSSSVGYFEDSVAKSCVFLFK